MTKYLVCCLLLLLGSAQAATRCEEEMKDKSIYQQFKSYRLALNKAEDLADLEAFFSKRYKDYFIKHIKGAPTSERSQWLEQYWNNLTIASDIISVYQQRSHCKENKRILELLTVLTDKKHKVGQTLALWRVNVHFVSENQKWLIDRIEYQPSTRKTPRNLPLIDNFSLITVM